MQHPPAGGGHCNHSFTGRQLVYMFCSSISFFFASFLQTVDFLKAIWNIIPNPIFFIHPYKLSRLYFTEARIFLCRGCRCLHPVRPAGKAGRREGYPRLPRDQLTPPVCRVPAATVLRLLSRPAPPGSRHPHYIHQG